MLKHIRDTWVLDLNSNHSILMYKFFAAPNSRYVRLIDMIYIVSLFSALERKYSVLYIDMSGVRGT
jgi:hypothetical protein